MKATGYADNTPTNNNHLLLCTGAEDSEGHWRSLIVSLIPHIDAWIVHTTLFNVFSGCIYPPSFAGLLYHTKVQCQQSIVSDYCSLPTHSSGIAGTNSADCDALFQVRRSFFFVFFSGQQRSIFVLLHKSFHLAKAHLFSAYTECRMVVYCTVS